MNGLFQRLGAAVSPAHLRQTLAIALKKHRKAIITALGLLALYCLTLGLLAPWLIEQQLQQMAKTRLQLELQIEKLRINPFSLSLDVENLQLSGEGLAKPLGFQRLYINFQLSSLWRWAWSFKECHLLGVYGQLVRNQDGTTNFSPLIARWQASAPAANDQAQKPETQAAAPRLWIEDFQITLDAWALDDLTLATAFHTQLGPINLQAANLSSLPHKTGQQRFSLNTPQGLQVQWNGTISLQPFSSSGQFQLRGPLLHLASEYLQDQLAFSIPADKFSLAFAYQFSLAFANQLPAGKQLEGDAQHPLQVELKQINLDLRELQLVDKHQQTKIFQLHQAKISNASLTWPAQQLRLPQVTFNQGELWVNKNALGEINLAQLVGPQTRETAPHTTPQNAPQTGPQSAPQNTSSASSRPWNISSQKLGLQNWAIHWRDQSLPTSAQLDVKNFQLALAQLSNQPEQKMQFTTGFNLGDGQLASHGQFQLLPHTSIEAEISAQRLPLTPLQAYAQTLAKIELKSGELSFKSSLGGDNLSQLRAETDLQIDNLELFEQHTQRKILGWSQLALKQIQTDVAQHTLGVAGIDLHNAFTDFAIASNGSTTLDRIVISANSAAGAHGTSVKDTSVKAADSNSAPTNSAAAANPNTWQIHLGKISLEDASGVFSDDSLPLPFKADIDHLNGYITSIDSQATAPAQLKMKGRVGQYGQLQIGGKLLPLSPKDLTQIKLKFTNLDIPEFSPYSIKFAGRKIAKGKMDLDLNYAIKQGAMEGRNNLVLRDFNLGQRVEQPGALDLPLDLAIALLKDSDGTIHADLPVSGKLDDPQFNYGRVIGQALTSLIGNLVTAPFKLLANLAGVSNGEDFGKINLDAGSSDITPPEQEKLAKLAKAMEARPELHLEIAGVYQPELDRQALARQKLLQSLRTSLSDDQAELDLNDKQQIKILERFYKTLALQPELNDLQNSFTPAAKNTAVTAATQAQSTYSSALLDKLLAAQPIAQNELEALAQQRAQNIYEALVAKGLNAQRLQLNPLKAVKKPRKDQLKLPLKISLGH